MTRWRLGLERRRARHHHREDGSRFSLLHYEYDDELAKEIVVGPSAHTARECPVNYRMMTAVNVTTAFMRHRLAHPSSRWSMLPVMVNIIIPHVNQHNRPELFFTYIDRWERSDTSAEQFPTNLGAPHFMYKSLFTIQDGRNDNNEKRTKNIHSKLLHTMTLKVNSK